ncbi:MAG: cytochrome c-type biogenesis protein CcmH [Chloroflexaceae bacterium]|jgi:hypothetical protein|nr:cytochrome c-type biogenesis protein CcmH [Chloroflexaceae bacterium]
MARALTAFLTILAVLTTGQIPAFVIGASNSSIPARFTGPFLCPEDTTPRSVYVRSMGGSSGPQLQCLDATGRVVAESMVQFWLLWSAPFALLHLLVAGVIWLNYRQRQYTRARK